MRYHLRMLNILVSICLIVPIIMDTASANSTADVHSSSNGQAINRMRLEGIATSPEPLSVIGTTLTQQTIEKDVSVLNRLMAPHPGDNVTRGPDQLVYNIDTTVDPIHHTFAGHLILHLHNNTAAPLRKLYFNVWPDALHYIKAGGSQTVNDVEFQGKPVPYSQNGTILTLTLASPLQNNQSGIVSMDFRATLPATDDRYGWEGTTINFGNWFPMLAVHDEHGFITPPYYTDGESFYSLTAAFHLHVTAPKNEVIAITGDSINNSDLNNGEVIHNYDALGVRDVAMVANSAFKIISKKIGNTTVSTYYTSEVANQANLMENVALNSLKYYSEHYGMYPYKSLSVCAMHGWFGGMEYPQLVMISFSDGGNSVSETTTDVAHEVAHQWFYSMVGDDQYLTPWVDESFATFSENRFDNHKLSANDIGPLSAHVTYPVSAFTSSDFTGPDTAYYDAVYLGGALMLQDLMNMLGTSRFDEMMKAYVRRYQYQVATTSDFMTFASSYTGLDLLGFFHAHGVYAGDEETTPVQAWVKTEETENHQNWYS